MFGVVGQFVNFVCGGARERFLQQERRVEPSLESDAAEFVSPVVDNPAVENERRQRICKAQKNARKAIEEHRKKVGTVLLSSAQVVLSEQGRDLNAPALTISHSVFAKQGKDKPLMEDRHFVVQRDGGTLVGVFDGHLGDQVAEYASKRVPQLFFDLLRSYDNDVCKTMSCMFSTIEKEIELCPELIATQQEQGKLFYELFQHAESFVRRYQEVSFRWTKSGDPEGERIQRNLPNYQSLLAQFPVAGSTGVVCWIDTANKIYTATIGDCEAMLFRRVQETRYVIPLSVVRDWSSPKDYSRLCQAQPERGTLSYMWKHWNDGPSTIRFSPFYELGNGLNMSRSLGDTVTKKGLEPSPMRAKEKLTVNNLLPDDRLVVASDGFWDVARMRELALLLTSHATDAKFLTNHAVQFNRAMDDVTVVVLNATAS